jgi:predicted transcriptional regulator
MPNNYQRRLTMSMELRGEWDDLCEKVKELRNQGYTVLQIEEETGFDYEDVLWAVAKMETMGFIGIQTGERNEI